MCFVLDYRETRSGAVVTDAFVSGDAPGGSSGCDPGTRDERPIVRCDHQLFRIRRLQDTLDKLNFRREQMARYGKAAGKSVRSAMRRRKKGTLRPGKAGKGGRVKSRKQAIAIGLSEARKKGAKVPRKRSS